MIYNIIGSGSKGNAVVLNKYMMIDCGVSFKALSAVYKDLKIVLLTHIHGDHFNKSTIQKLAQERPTLRWACGKWLISDLAELGVSKNNIDILPMNKTSDYGVFSVTPFNVRHNVQNCGFAINFKPYKVFYCTDCNSLDHVSAKNFDLYMVEANYKENEIAIRIAEKKVNGMYCYEYQVLKNHLSYEKAMDWIVKNAGANSEYILMHKHE